MRALHVEEVIHSLNKQVHRSPKKPAITKLFINNIVLVQVAEYLENNTEYTSDDIVNILHSLLNKEENKFENREIVIDALTIFSNTKNSFSDCLQTSINKEYFCFDEEMDVKTQPSSGVAAI